MDRRLSNDPHPLDVALRLYSEDFLSELRSRLKTEGLTSAVALHDTSALFNWIVSLLPLQGVSDAAAITYRDVHGGITWADVQEGLGRREGCSRLRSWWHFECGFRKAQWTCAEPKLIAFCPLPQHPLRKGSLNQAAYGLALFLRDCCNGDLVAWIDHRLRHADLLSHPFERGKHMSTAVTEILKEVPGTGQKLWSMVFADILLAADPERERWVTAGASMIAVDTLVHGWLHRTGTLRQHRAEHPYGPGCYGPTGCAAVIERLAQTVDARAFNPAFPSYFPRFVQVAIWEFCAEAGRNICNGNQIDDRYPCRQVFCPAHSGCERRALHPL